MDILFVGLVLFIVTVCFGCVVSCVRGYRVFFVLGILYLGLEDFLCVSGLFFFIWDVVLVVLRVVYLF